MSTGPRARFRRRPRGGDVVDRARLRRRRRAAVILRMVALEFVQRRIALDAAMGALIGCLLAAPVLWMLGRAAARLDSGLISAGSFGPIDWLQLATVPIAGIALAVFTARVTVLGALRKKL